MTDYATFWWRHVPGPSRYLNDVVGAAFKHRVILVEQAPYFGEFAALVREHLRQWDSGLLVDDADGGCDPGDWIISRYAREAEYHPLDGTKAAFAAERKLLAGRVVMVHDVQHFPQWVPFAVEYARHSPSENGLMMLTYRGGSPLSAPRKGVAVFQWSDYFTPYDMQWFAAYCLSEREESCAAVRDYRIQFISRLAGGDPALCAELSLGPMRGDPLARLNELAAEHSDAARLSRDRKRLDFLLWEAQLQVVFPLVERLRRRFIDAYRRELEGVLPKRDDFGVELKEPEDMEIRHLWYYYFAGSGEGRMFHSREDEQAFRKLYFARNQLAHLKPLDHAAVMELLPLDEYVPEPQR